MRKVLATAFVAAFAAACSSGDVAQIDGKFYGASDKMIFLEKLSPSGSTIVDSAKASSNGAFKFKISFTDPATPSFYNIRMAQSFVPLLVKSGERIDLNSVGNIYNNYTVEGSEGSALLRELNQQTITASQQLDSLFQLYEASTDPEINQALGRQYGQQYVEFKRNVIRFVMKNAGSLVSIVPLYQPIFGTKFIFDDPQDILYYQIIADSLESRYPNSPYTKSLRQDVQRAVGTAGMLADTTALKVSDFPEIAMKDAAGKMQKLSDLKGKVILLDFTATSDPKLKILNRELIDTYSKFKDRGFEIFQVSLDASRVDWTNYITDNRIPWISVCDFQGAQSPAAMVYNIQKLPANFLIDRQGNIVGRDLHEQTLESNIEKIL